jgi:hypothetical protein
MRPSSTNVAEFLLAVIIALFVLGVVLPNVGPAPDLGRAALSVPGLVCIFLSVAPIVLIVVGMRSRRIIRLIGWGWLALVLAATIALPYIHM